jgi:hypothetical protein
MEFLPYVAEASPYRTLFFLTALSLDYALGSQDIDAQTP